MNKFKIGDRVENLAEYIFADKGEKGTVLEGNSNAPYIGWDNGRTQVRVENALRLAEEPSNTINWEMFKQGKFAVHCDTEEKMKLFLLECEMQDIEWASGDKPTTAIELEAYDNTHCYYHRCLRSGIWVLSYTEVKYFTTTLSLDIVEYQPNFREVKRPAKVGEWIKIANAITDVTSDYRNGDILKVVEADREFLPPPIEDSPAFYQNGRYCYFALEEYVVLERCEPEAPKKPKTLADYTSKELAYELLKRCGEGKNK